MRLDHFLLIDRIVDLNLDARTIRIDATVPGMSVRVGLRTGEAREIPAPLPESVRYVGFHHGATFREHEEFRSCLLGDRQVKVPLRDGLWSVAMGAS